MSANGAEHLVGSCNDWLWLDVDCVAWYAEKIAEATRKFAALQSDLSTSIDVIAASSNGLRRRSIVPTTLLRRRNKSNSAREPAVYKSLNDIKLALSEFYLSLILLQNYQSLNFTGFQKILKKHDKVPQLLVFCEYWSRITLKTLLFTW